MVSEVCARGYRAGRARKKSERGAERVVGQSAAGAAVRVEEEEITLGGQSYFLALTRCASACEARSGTLIFGVK